MYRFFSSENHRLRVITSRETHTEDSKSSEVTGCEGKKKDVHLITAFLIPSVLAQHSQSSHNQNTEGKNNMVHAFLNPPRHEKKIRKKKKRKFVVSPTKDSQPTLTSPQIHRVCFHRRTGSVQFTSSVPKEQTHSRAPRRFSSSSGMTSSLRPISLCYVNCDTISFVEHIEFTLCKVTVWLALWAKGQPRPLGEERGVKG